MTKIVHLADHRSQRDRDGSSAGSLTGAYDLSLLTPEERHQKLRELASADGHDSVADMFECAVTHQVAPCICLTCGATAGLKADDRAGWCHACGNPHMVSCLLLADGL
jgi:hypothetical protein